MSSPAKPDLSDVLPRLNDMMREDDHWGDVAAYIPQLAKVDPAQFGIAVVTADGVDERAVAYEPVFVHMAAEVHELVQQVDAGGSAHDKPSNVGCDQPTEQ